MTRLILQEIEKRAKKHSKYYAFFDLDSTIFNLDQRQLSIFKEFAQQPEFRKKFSAECDLLLKMQASDLCYYPEEALLKMGLKKIGPQFSPIFHQFWSERFFSNDYLKYDRLEPGVQQFIEKLESWGSEILFLTGRDAPRMGDGTERELVRHQLLPAAGRKLILKPNKELLDHTFKLDVLRQLRVLDEQILFIDNEPHNLNLIHEHHPETYLILFDSYHSGRAEPISTMQVMKSFEF